MLEGDSFHTISNVQSLFGFTGDTLSANGLGPYYQRETWKLAAAPIGGEISSIFTLDKRGYISGSILGFNIDDQLRPVSWAEITAETRNYNITQYSWDGYYEMYLDPGSFNITLQSVGYKTIKTNSEIAPGQFSLGLDFQLELDHKPSSLQTSLVIVPFRREEKVKLESIMKAHCW